MSTNVYKRFDPRVMEREERIGINRGLPTMILSLLKSHVSQTRFHLLYIFYSKYWRDGVSVMVFNATVNNISVTSNIVYRGGQFYWWINPESTRRKPPTCCKSL